MAGEAQTSYDRLFVTRLFFFLALIALVNLTVVALAYTFALEKPFAQVLAQERGYFGHGLGYELHQNMRYEGDRFYDTMFVRTGVERVAYEELRAAREADVAAEAVFKLRMFGDMMDNCFDYLLLLCYRLGFLLVSMSYVGCLLLAVVIHGGLIRHRKRYGFGDTPLMLNLWARATLSFALPITLIVWTLPLALPPIVLTASLAGCVFGMAVFAFSLPKVA